MRNCDQDYKEIDPDSNMYIHHFEKRKSACKVEDFGVHSGLTPYGDKDALKNHDLHASGDDNNTQEVDDSSGADMQNF